MTDGHEPAATPEDMIKLLEQYGGKRAVDVLRPLYIYFSREAQHYQNVVFWKGTNEFNHHTLLEFCAGFNWKESGTARQFPDLAHVRINRLDPKTGKTNDISVNLEEILKSGDCSKDMPLEWGDIVEAPEMDHRVGEVWQGLSPEIKGTLTKCLTRNVTVVVKGETNQFKMQPWFTDGLGAYSPLGTCYLQRVVSFFQRTSSDLEHIKIARRSPAGKTQTIVFSEKPPVPVDLLLEDGDVVELTEREPELKKH